MHAGTPRALRHSHRLLLTAVFLLLAPAAHAQLSVYANFTASRLAGGPAGDYLYGGTFGMLIDTPSPFTRMVPSVNVQLRDVALNGERFLSGSLGPRVRLPLAHPRITPYAEFLVGFGRYRSTNVLPNAGSTTDSLWQINAGVARPMNSHVDLTAEFGYSQFGYNDGQYNPKHFSAGFLYHFVGR